MWIVRNTLRGTLSFRGLGISIRSGERLDLDEAMFREQAETNNQILVAFEEGYLETVKKDNGVGRASQAPAGVTSAELEEKLEDRFKEFKEALASSLQGLRSDLSGDVKGMLQSLKVAKLRLNEEKQRILVDQTLSEAEIKARIAFLEEQERELSKNFQSIGRKADQASDNVEAKADLLSSI